MRLLRELTETSRRLEINRTVELQSVRSEIKKGLKALGDPPRSVISPEQTILDMVRQWMWGPDVVGGSAPLMALSEQAHQAREYDTERRIIEWLSFQEMNDRQADIKKAHLQTFEWVFSTSEISPSPTHFNRWLEQGDGIFWISGKPGSGKSTLMKYIYCQSCTTESLNQWAGNTTLVRACYYFWTAGTPLQKSIEGLLRSLVCQILRQCPSLIRVVFPDEWAQSIQLMERVPFVKSFDRDTFTQAINSITRATDLDAKFCFFIDGLDEFEGFDRDIASIISTLASSQSVKICVASRPHNAFVNAFGGNIDQVLYVHEYTNSDIQKYIKDVLEKDAAFVSRTQQDPEGYQQLVEYIRKEANSVFLWVYLVIVNMLDGMVNADRMSDLQRKLRRVPTDLKALFAHILNTVEADYHEHQAQMLQVACQTEEPLNLIGYSFLDEEDPDFALDCPAVPMQPEVVSRRYEYMEKRVVARCKLLLEVVERPTLNPGFPKCVTFLHRTVRDYLQEPEAQELLASRLSGPFDPRRKLCDALLAEIKCTSMPSRNLAVVHRLVLRLLHVVKEVERISNTSLTSHLDSLKSAIHLKRGNQFDWWQGPGDSLARFLQLVVRSSLAIYLEWRLHDTDDGRELSLRQKAGLLLSSLSTESYELPLDLQSTTAIVKTLLKCGADPNFLYQEHNITPWTGFVLSALNRFKHSADNSNNRKFADPELDRQLFLLFEQMILAGADLDIMYLPPSLFTEGKILSPKQQHQREGLLTIEQCIEQTMTPSNASYLLDLVRRHRRLTKKNKFMFTWQDSGFIFFMLVLIIVYGRYRQVRGIAPIHNSRNEL